MDEMSIWLDDRTDFGEAFFLLVTVRREPSLKETGGLHSGRRSWAPTSSHKKGLGSSGLILDTKSQLS